ncbi:MAG TPA: hypothetical protein VNO43_00395 [Candidatus Eisenbacteria bacterium]|nr:hypothetical protein [Candidatus Eisenbacteria bacterium]
MAERFGASHVPEISCNEFGTPLLNDVFGKAQNTATHALVCFANADIILMQDFARAIDAVSNLNESFLMVGRRWNVEINAPLDFQRDDWQEQLRTVVNQRGKCGLPYYIDYFVFRKGLFGNLPPFVIGRAGFDNWLLWRARSSGAMIVDASQMVMAIHQNHDYAHHPEGRDGVYLGLEAKRNRELMGGSHHLFTLEDATHFLTSDGLKRNLSRRYFRRKWKFIRRALRHRWREWRTSQTTGENGSPLKKT